MEIEELPVWIIKSVTDDPDDPTCSVVELTRESDPDSWMKVRLKREDAADLEVGMKAQHAVISEEAN